MSNKNIEQMKKLIEEKKMKNKDQSSSNEKPSQKIGSSHKAIKSKRKGGFFDK
ncbi:hypothetical protein EDC18_102284 [Natranaerovirga pectinivora]|uniref:Uncharacterized protein n=1 Tax=Natranaerovirga pectinivora TaxID=682400 RepID=A0A4V2V0I4_9FIRM|nr:hypothetical protein [Natranaerovirga pectinivora]TCT16267.1 hypothetical protein EDC18_102284 [Natranaerovirga pectinivora]